MLQQLMEMARKIKIIELEVYISVILAIFSYPFAFLLWLPEIKRRMYSMCSTTDLVDVNERNNQYFEGKTQKCE